jgi:hypothetical protein
MPNRRQPAALDLSYAWRFTALGGLAVGLALSPAAAGADRAQSAVALAVSLAAGAGLAIARPRGRTGAVSWLALTALAAAVAGAVLGALRLQAIDAGAFEGPPGSELAVRG